MKHLIKRIKGSRKKIKHFLRFGFFCFIGGASFLIDWSFFNFFYNFGISFVVAVTLSFCISMIFNFSVNRNITFSARGQRVRRQIYRWLIIYFIAFLIRVGSGKVILILLGESLFVANIAFIIGVVLAIPVSFFGSLLWAFKKEEKQFYSSQF